MLAQRPRGFPEVATRRLGTRMGRLSCGPAPTFMPGSNIWRPSLSSHSDTHSEHTDSLTSAHPPRDCVLTRACYHQRCLLVSCLFLLLSVESTVYLVSHLPTSINYRRYTTFYNMKVLPPQNSKLNLLVILMYELMVPSLKLMRTAINMKTNLNVSLENEFCKELIA